MLPLLHQRFESLATTLPYHAIRKKPSPVRLLETLSRHAGNALIWVKDDGYNPKQVGAGAIRKLEWILGHAQAAGAKRLLAVGGNGSEFVLAAAAYGHHTLGARIEAWLFEQPPSRLVTKIDRALERLLVDTTTTPSAAAIHTKLQLQRVKGLVGTSSSGNYTIDMSGGLRGTLGFVEAALELKAQLSKDALPAPAAIILAAESGASAAGLLLGLRLAEIDTQVIAVDTHGALQASAIRGRANDTAKLLDRAGIGITKPHFSTRDITLLQGFHGQGAGLPTAASTEAASLLSKTERLKLGPTTSAKAMSATLNLIFERPELRKEPVLFWNTHNAHVPGLLLRGGSSQAEAAP